MGAFAYSEEDDTWAAKNLKGPDSGRNKAKRLDLLMEAQMTIYEEKMLRCMAKRSHFTCRRDRG